MISIFLAGYANGNDYDCRCLVFARTQKEARELAYYYVSSKMLCNIEDIQAVKLKNREDLRCEWPFGESHVVTSEEISFNHVCKCCGAWWKTKIGPDHLCDDCRKEYQEGY